jgi:alkanesulfonate monooxygenase SsuD/methylene tetrahydromethanopterin reductase-like flavin-dependent oxidoreductase (luciferase family)
MTALPAFGLYLDFRNPAPWALPWDRFYAEVFDQVAWAEELGYGSVWISQHHLVADGYTPSPLALAAAVATRTSRVEIGTSIVILPLHHPVTLAEDALTVDALSGGRFRLGVGAGYRPGEFAALAVPMAERFTRFEDGLRVLRAAFDGRALDGGPRHPELDGVVVTPGPLEGGGPELWVGSFGPKGIERAGRYGDGFLVSIPSTWPPYLEACARHGRTPRVVAAQHWIIGDDPEAELHRSLPHVLHQVNEYGEGGAYGTPWVPATTAEDVLTRSPYSLVDPDELVRRIVELARTGFVEDVNWWTRFPGEPVERANERLEWFMRTIAPKVATALS